MALGNAPYSDNIVSALIEKQPEVSELVAEHISWALTQQKNKKVLTEKVAAEQGKNHRLTLRLIRSVEKGLSRDA